jgi:hypothetical protein
LYHKNLIIQLNIGQKDGKFTRDHVNDPDEDQPFTQNTECLRIFITHDFTYEETISQFLLISKISCKIKSTCVGKYREFCGNSNFLMMDAISNSALFCS